MIVRNQFNCTDSLVKRVDVEPLLTYWLPNAFTPNGDGSNDEYRGRGVLDDLGGFTMRIWNRWGELIFQTNSPTEGWNGRKYNSGEASQQGVYLCVVNYSSRRGEDFEIRSYATLIR
ncbi:MAG: gliding motility-associated C-terminal domain-containing protein [Saprospiraceae bacterium]|nr:gliding motility-associated C-terminal domain-containing protein [Saprospiraceae bacterium]